MRHIAKARGTRTREITARGKGGKPLPPHLMVHPQRAKPLPMHVDCNARKWYGLAAYHKQQNTLPDLVYTRGDYIVTDKSDATSIHGLSDCWAAAMAYRHLLNNTVEVELVSDRS